MICAYLLHDGISSSPEEALNLFSMRRTDKFSPTDQGVTGPSQKRYVEYFARVISKGVPPADYTSTILAIQKIKVILGKPLIDDQEDHKIHTLDRKISRRSTHGFNYSHQFCGIICTVISNDNVQEKEFSSKQMEEGKIEIDCSFLVKNEVKVELTRAKKKICYLWLHTDFVEADTDVVQMFVFTKDYILCFKFV